MTTLLQPVVAPCCSSLRRGLATLLTFALLISGAFAQSTSTGTITGRVFVPSSGEYVRHAEVRVQNTALAAVSEDGGYFRITNVPAGDVTLTVFYSGFISDPAHLQVRPGETTSHDFNLASSDASAKRAASDGTVMLDAVVISTEREGNAKAIMQQRNSMTVGRSVASDVFGDVTEGNVGEFLKYLPGVELEYVEADTRGPRLGGMDPQYVGVSIDGMKAASADAFVQYGATENGDTGSGTRSFGFEQVSINSIESIEIHRVSSAAMDADAPAGTINLKTKRGFDRKGRRLDWSLGTVLNTEEFHFKNTVGPGDRGTPKYKPNYSLTYSDTFLGNRLGVVVVFSESNLYNEQYRIDHTYNRTATTADPRPQVLTQIAFKDGPKWTQRRSFSINADYKATDNLVLSLTTNWQEYDARFYNRTVTIGTTGRQSLGGDGVNFLGTNPAATPAGTLSTGGGSGVKLTRGLTIIPRFEYRLGNFLFDGAFSYSRSDNDYDNMVRGTVSTTAVNGLAGVGFTATRSDPKLADWQVTQTAGPDWANLGNYTNPRIGDDGRSGRNEIYTTSFNTRYDAPFVVPTFLVVGAKVQDQSFKYDQLSPVYNWSYVGPGGNTRNPNGTLTTTGTFANYRSPYVFDMGQTGGTFRSISGGGAPAFASRDDLGDLYKTNPEYFVNTATADNVATAYFLNHREYEDSVSAGYAIFNTRHRRWFQGGVRYELTEKESKDFDPLLNSQVAAAGFPVAMVNGQPTGNPTTVAGVIHKYTTNPRVTRTGDYHNYFPSLTAKYRITDSLIADFGWGKGIKRPDINRINGVWNINETAQEITAPNPNLLPELSDKYIASLAWYFGRNGTNVLQLVASHTKIKHLLRERDLTAEEFFGGAEIPEGLEEYTFITGTSEGPPVDFRSLELSYSQVLSFLPSWLRGSSVFAGYTRTYATERRKGLAPHTVKAGVTARYKRVSLGLSAVWLDETPSTNTIGRFRRQNTKFDVMLNYKLTESVSLFAQGRNVFETPHRIFETINGNEKVLWRLENYGTNWSFGVKGRF
jgi:iron complex outermembrane recepter protein